MSQNPDDTIAGIGNYIRFITSWFSIFKNNVTWLRLILLTMSANYTQNIPQIYTSNLCTKSIHQKRQYGQDNRVSLLITMLIHWANPKLIVCLRYYFATLLFFFDKKKLKWLIILWHYFWDNVRIINVRKWENHDTISSKNFLLSS